MVCRDDVDLSDRSLSNIRRTSSSTVLISPSHSSATSEGGEADQMQIHVGVRFGDCIDHVQRHRGRDRKDTGLGLAIVRDRQQARE